MDHTRQPLTTHDMIDMDALAATVRRLGTTAWVELTGGNVAMLFAGPERADETEPGAVRYGAIAGPGAYGWGQQPSVASIAGFSVGPDDGGVAPAAEVAELGPTCTLRDLARLIVAQAQQADPSQPLATEARAALFPPVAA